MQQSFHGNVGVVAGRDIVYSRGDLADLDDDALRQEQERYKAKLWQARKDLLFGAPSLLLVCCMLGLVALLFSGWWFRILALRHGNWLQFACLAVVVFLSLWIRWRRERIFGKRIAYYKNKIEQIELILHDRT